MEYCVEKACKLKEQGWTWAEIAKELNMHKDKVRSMVRRENEKRAFCPSSSHDTFQMMPYKEEVKSDGTVSRSKVLELKHGVNLTPELCLELHGFEVGEWSVLSIVNNFWQSQKKGGELLDLYQSKITVKPLVNGLSIKKITEHFDKMSREYVQPVSYKSKISGKRKMCEVNTADCHLGKLCWHGDTGKDYDHKIAVANFKSIIERVCEKITNEQPEVIYFVWTNDFFNSDTINDTTTAGTQQDSDLRWQKMFNVGCDLLVWAIDMLKQIAPVKTFYTRDNHSQQKCYYAIQYLNAWFRNDPNVEVSIDATPRKYIKYGNTLIGFDHGDKMKPAKLASLMPVEARRDWADTEYHEFHVGHLHSEHATNEVNGVIVRRISSPTANDTWHVENGFVGSVRKAQTFVYDYDNGLEAIYNTPVL